MFKVWKFYYDGSWGGGLGLVGAKTEKDAERFVAEYSKEDYDTPFVLGEVCEHLITDKEGILEKSFYIE